MAINLPSKPGITGASVLSVPDQWSPSWFRGFVSNLLKGADVRNAVGAGGITVTGNIASPYATITYTGAGGTSTGAAVSLTSGSSQSIPNNTTTPVNFNNTLFDTGSYYSGGNPSRFTVAATGLYSVHASICWDSPSGGERMLFICKNGNYSVQYAANIIPGGGVTSGYNPACSTSCVMSLTAGDYIEACAYHDAVAPVNVQGVNSFWTTFSIKR